MAGKSQGSGSGRHHQRHRGRTQLFRFSPCFYRIVGFFFNFIDISDFACHKAAKLRLISHLRHIAAHARFQPADCRIGSRQTKENILPEKSVTASARDGDTLRISGKAGTRTTADRAIGGEDGFVVPTTTPGECRACRQPHPEGFPRGQSRSRRPSRPNQGPTRREDGRTRHPNAFSGSVACPRSSL